MTRTKRTRGAAAATMLFVMMVTVTTIFVVAQMAGAGMMRSKREVVAAQSFQHALSGVEYKFQLLQDELADTYGEFHAESLDYSKMPIDLPADATGTLTILPIYDGSYAWVTSEVKLGGVPRSVRLLVSSKDVSIWNNVIFAGSGAAGQAINGNVDVRGSVHLLGDGEAYKDLNGNGKRDEAEPFTDLNLNGNWDPGEPYLDLSGDGAWNPAEPYNDSNNNGMYDPPLTVTELNSSFSGNAHIGNNYDGMPSTLSSRIPPIPNINGFNTLSSDVRVKHGMIKLQGTATIGYSPNYGGNKYTVDGTYVNDGWTGSGGAGSVFSDNGTNQGYDLGDRLTFPLINGIGAEPYLYKPTNTSYNTFQEFLDSRSMTIPLGEIEQNMGAVTYGPDAYGNRFEWVPAVGEQPARMRITGIVKIAGNLNLGKMNQTIYYEGRGTLYATDTIHCHANLLPAPGRIFPTQAVLGLLGVKGIDLATGAGDSQLTMLGAFYSQGVIKSAKQNQIAGTFVSNFFDMGTNVPNIYQVPELRKNLPPGMPGDETIVSVKRRTWRERAPK